MEESISGAEQDFSPSNFHDAPRSGKPAPSPKKLPDIDFSSIRTDLDSLKRSYEAKREKSHQEISLLRARLSEVHSSSNLDFEELRKQESELQAKINQEQERLALQQEDQASLKAELALVGPSGAQQGSIDDQVAQFESSASLNAILASTKQRNAERKRPVQNASRGRRIEFQRDVVAQLEAAILKMRERLQLLDSDRRNMLEQIKILDEQQSQVAIELEGLRGGSKAAEGALVTAKQNLQDHEKVIAKASAEYAKTHDDLEAKIAADRKREAQVLATIASLERRIRELDIDIQRLSSQRTYTVVLYRWKPHPLWGIINLSQLPPEPLHSHPVFGKFIEQYSEVRDNPVVIGQIAGLGAVLAEQKSTLASSQADLAAIRASIKANETALADCKQRWHTTKLDLNDKKYALEDAIKDADNAAANARKLVALSELKQNGLREQSAHVRDQLDQLERQIQLRQETLSKHDGALAREQKHLDSLLQQDPLVESTASSDAGVTPPDPVADPKSRESLLKQLRENQHEESLVAASLASLRVKLEELQKLFSEPDKRNRAKALQGAILSLETEIENARVSLRNLREAYLQQIGAVFLSEGLILSAFSTKKQERFGFFVCLLQAVFENFPRFSLGSTANAPVPEAFAYHLERLCNLLRDSDRDLTLPATEMWMLQALQAVNDEFCGDGVRLEVTLLGRRLNPRTDASHSLHIWRWEDDPVDGEGSKRCQFVILRHEQLSQRKGKRFERVYQWLSHLGPPNPHLAILCPAILLRDLGKRHIADCSVEELADYLRDRLAEDDKSLLIRRVENESALEIFISQILEKYPLADSDDKETVADDAKPFLKSAKFVLETIRVAQRKLYPEQQTEALQLLRDLVLNATRSLIVSEISHRKDQSIKASTSASSLQEVLKSTEANISVVQRELSEIEARLAENGALIEKRRQQAAIVQASFNAQSRDLQEEANRLETLQKQLEDELRAAEEVLKSDSTSPADLAGSVEKTAEVVEKLRKQLQEASSKLAEAQQQKLAIDLEEKNATSELNQARKMEETRSNLLKAENAKIAFVETWTAFLERVHAFLLNDERSYTDRANLLSKIVPSSSASVDLVALYEQLHSLVPALKDSDLEQRVIPMVKTTEDPSLRSMTVNWPRDLLAVVKDALRDPSFFDDGVSRCTISGNNIVWSQLLQLLEAQVSQRMEQFGFAFEGDRLVVKSVGLVGKVEQLPERLRNFFMRHFYIHVQHVTQISESRVDQSPVWEEAKAFMSQAQWDEFLRHAQLNTFDVITAYWDSIEILAAYNVYLDINVAAPSANLTIVAKRIHCLPDLSIHTTPKQQAAFRHAVARSGDFYQQREGRNYGRDGDDGLDGPAGDAAGNIVLEADEIVNLESLKIIANGTNGIFGQKAGAGGKGHPGTNMPHADADDTNGFGKAQFYLAQGRIPGMDEHGNFTRTTELSKPGGDAGLPGNGGGPGLPGDVSIKTLNEYLLCEGAENRQLRPSPALDTLLQQMERNSGSEGLRADCDAAGGEPGEAGTAGMDMLRNKRGFFRTTGTVYGEFSEDAFKHPHEYMRADEDCGIDFNVFSADFYIGGVHGKGFCDRFQQQVRGYGAWIDAPQLRSEEQCLQNPKRDIRSRTTTRGRSNEGRVKQTTPAQCRRTLTLKQQTQQVSRLQQQAEVIRQSHPVHQCVVQYRAEAQQFKKRAENLENEVEALKARQADLASRQAALQEQQRQSEISVNALKDEVMALNGLIDQQEQVLSEEQTSALNALEKAAQRNFLLSEIREKACLAAMDVAAAKETSQHLEQVRADLQLLIRQDLNELSQKSSEISAERIARLQQLAEWQAQFGRIEAQIRDAEKAAARNSALDDAIDKILQQDKEQSTQNQADQHSILASPPEPQKALSLASAIPLPNQAVSVPSVETQLEIGLALIADVFRNSHIDSELKKSLQKADSASLWIEVLATISRQHKELDNDRILSLLAILRYFDTIVKVSEFPFAVLHRLFLKIEALIELPRFEARVTLVLSQNCFSLLNSARQRTMSRCDSPAFKTPFEQALSEALAARASPEVLVNFRAQFSFLRALTKFCERHASDPNLWSLLPFVLKATAQLRSAASETGFFADVADVVKAFGLPQPPSAACMLLVLAEDGKVPKTQMQALEFYFSVQPLSPSKCVVQYICRGKSHGKATIMMSCPDFLASLNPKWRAVSGPKLLEDALKPHELFTIARLTGLEHFSDGSVFPAFFFDSVLLEIEYLSVESLMQLDVPIEGGSETIAAPSTQNLIAVVQKRRLHALHAVNALRSASKESGTQLAHQCVRVWQVLLLAEKQLRIREFQRSGNPNFAAVLGKQMVEIMEETATVVARNRWSEDMLIRILRRSFSQFIDNLSLSSTELLSVLDERFNAPLLTTRNFLLADEILTKILRVEAVHRDILQGGESENPGSRNRRRDHAASGLRNISSCLLALRSLDVDASKIIMSSMAPVLVSARQNLDFLINSLQAADASKWLAVSAAIFQVWENQDCLLSVEQVLQGLLAIMELREGSDLDEKISSAMSSLCQQLSAQKTLVMELMSKECGRPCSLIGDGLVFASILIAQPKNATRLCKATRACVSTIAALLECSDSFLSLDELKSIEIGDNAMHGSVLIAHLEDEVAEEMNKQLSSVASSLNNWVKRRLQALHSGAEAQAAAVRAAVERCSQDIIAAYQSAEEKKCTQLEVNFVRLLLDKILVSLLRSYDGKALRTVQHEFEALKGACSSCSRIQILDQLVHSANTAAKTSMRQQPLFSFEAPESLRNILVEFQKSLSTSDDPLHWCTAWREVVRGISAAGIAWEDCQQFFELSVSFFHLVTMPSKEAEQDHLVQAHHAIRGLPFAHEPLISNLAMMLEHCCHFSEYFLYSDRVHQSLRRNFASDLPASKSSKSMNTLLTVSLTGLDSALHCIEVSMGSTSSVMKTTLQLEQVPPMLSERAISEAIVAFGSQTGRLLLQIGGFDSPSQSAASVNLNEFLATVVDWKFNPDHQTLALLRRFYIALFYYRLISTNSQCANELSACAASFVPDLSGLFEGHPHHSRCLMLVAGQLVSIFRTEYKERKFPTELECNSLMAFVDSVSASVTPLHTLQAYRHLYGISLPNSSSSSSLSVHASLIAKALGKHASYANLFQVALTEETGPTALPSLISVLPFLTAAEFSRVDCWSLLSSLLTFSGFKPAFLPRKSSARPLHLQQGLLAIEFSDRIRIIPLLTGYLIRTFIDPALTGTGWHRPLLSRLIRLADTQLLSCVPLHAGLSTASDPKAMAPILARVKRLVGIIMALDDVNLSVDQVLVHKSGPTQSSKGSTTSSTPRDRVSVSSLLTPIEKDYFSLTGSRSSVLESFAEGKVAITDWEAHLKGVFLAQVRETLASRFTVQKQRNKFYKVFFASSQVGKTSSDGTRNEAEQNWLRFLKFFLESVSKGAITIEQLQILLQSVVSLKNCLHFYKHFSDEAGGSSRMPALASLRCLFDGALLALEQSVTFEDFPDVEARLRGLEPVICGASFGFQFLGAFITTLCAYTEDTREKVNRAFLVEIFSLVETVEPFSDEELLRRLKATSLRNWRNILKPERFARAFGLKYSESSQAQIMCRHFAQLEQIATAKLTAELVTLLQKNIAHYKTVDELNDFLVNFVRQDWQLTPENVKQMSAVAPGVWPSLLSEAAKRHHGVKATDSTMAEVVAEMKKSISTINSPIRHLLEDAENPSQPLSPLELAERSIAAQASFCSSWTTASMFQEWSKAFKEDGVKRVTKKSPELYQMVAVLFRAAKVAYGYGPRPCQVAGFLAMLDAVLGVQGRLANVDTGEGKSLLTVLIAAAMALRGDQVDIVTSNEVLAVRDSKKAQRYFELFDIKVSNNCDAQCETENMRKERYARCQVIYGTTSSFQRDLLLTNFFDKPIRGQPGAATPGTSLIIDEVDSMFIDNAEKILYISHPIQDLRHLGDLFVLIWALVNAPDREVDSAENIDAIHKFVLDELQKEQSGVQLPTFLTTPSEENGQSFVQRRLRTWIRHAYAAKEMKLGERYVIPSSGEKHNQVNIIDLDTGVEQPTTQWSAGLHQFLQLKHSLKLSQESLKAVFMSNATFFKLYNGRIIGMTGTIGGEVERHMMGELYKVDHCRTPPNKPPRFRELEERVCGNPQEWIDAIVDDVLQCQSSQENKFSDEEIRQALKDLETIDRELNELKEQKAAAEREMKLLRASERNWLVQLADLVVQLGHEKPGERPTLRSGLMAQHEAASEKRNAIASKIEASQKSIDSLSEKIANCESKRRSAEFVMNKVSSRAVLVICASVADAEQVDLALRKSSALKHWNSHICLIRSKDDKMPESKLAPNDIIVATNIAGRGTDLETLDVLERNGGLHVILSYVPRNARIEIQAFRRTARNGNAGTGRFIAFQPEKNDLAQLSVALLKERNEAAEYERLETIRTLGIPKLNREQELFSRYVALQRRIRERLRDSLGHDPSEFDVKLNELQFSSLQNDWAFFLDSIENSIADVTHVSDEELFSMFETEFAQKMLSRVESLPFRFVTTPAELLKCAKLCMDEKVASRHSRENSFKLGEEFLDQIIKTDPKLSGYPLYYKVYCQIGQRKTSMGDKKRYRALLKQAAALFDSKLSRMSSAAQFLRVLQGRRTAQGLGGQVDEFTKSLTNEMGLLQVHLHAINEIIGVPISAGGFKSGPFAAGEEHTIVFKNLLESWSPPWLKTYRVGKHVSVKSGALYWRDSVVPIPPNFTAPASVVAIVAAALADPKRKIQRDAFNHLILTRERFLSAIGEICTKQASFTLHSEAAIRGKGRWTFGPLAACDKSVQDSVKQFVLTEIRSSVSLKELAEAFARIATLADADSKIVVKHLCEAHILQQKEGFLFTAASRSKVANYLNSIRINKNVVQGPWHASIKLEEFPELASIKERLIASIERHASAGTEVSAKDLDLNERQFRLLFQLLQRHGLFETSLLQRLDKVGAFDDAHRMDAEMELLFFYESSQVGAPADCRLPETQAELADKLWGYLCSMKVLKDPRIDFGWQDDPDSEFDRIENEVKNRWPSLVIESPKPAEENKKKLKRFLENSGDVVKAITDALESSLGRLKRWKDFKIERKTLIDYLDKAKVPPELLEFQAQGVDLVLCLKEAKGFHFGIIVVGLLGIIQITAGIIIGACSFGGAAFLSAVLISEGVSDLIFAVQCGISGEFSWAAYGNHKWQSLLISVCTAGIGVAVSGASTAAKGAGLTVAGFVKKFATILADGTISYLLSSLADSLIKTAVSELLNRLDADFENWVKSSEVYKTTKANLLRSIEACVTKFGDSAQSVVNSVLTKSAAERQKSFFTTFGPKLTESIQKLSSNLSLASEQLMRSGKTAASAAAAKIAKIAGIAATASDVVQRFMEMASLTSRVLNGYVESLDREIEQTAASSSTTAASSSSGQQSSTLATTILDALTKQIVDEIKALIKKSIAQPAIMAILQAAAEPLRQWTSSAINNLMTDVQKDIPQSTSMDDDISAVADHNASRGPASDRAAVEDPLTDPEAEGPSDPEIISMEQAFCRENVEDFPAGDSFLDSDLDFPGMNLPAGSGSASEMSVLDPNYDPAAASHSGRRPRAGPRSPIPHTLSRQIKGIIAERRMERTLLRAGYEMANAKIGSNNGFDGVFIKRNSEGQIVDIIIAEAKFSKDGVGKMGNPLKGQQMSEKWIQNTIREMEKAGGQVGELAKTLIQNESKIRLKFATMDPSGTVRYGTRHVRGLEASEFSLRKTPSNLPHQSGTGTNSAAHGQPASSAAPRGAGSSPAGSTLRSAAKLGGKVITAYAIYQDGNRVVQQAQRDAKTGDYTATAKVAAEVAGGWALSTVMATEGAKFGATIGTYAYPGLGTLIGGTLGGIAGGAFGYYTGQKMAASTFENVQNATGRPKY